MSPYSPLELHRPLKLFGASFRVDRSTLLTFNPDTLSRVVTGTSLDAGMQRHDPAQHQNLRKMAYLLKERHRPSEGTRRLVSSMASAGGSGLAARLVASWAGPTTADALESSWSNVRNGLGTAPCPVTQSLCECLADVDAHGLYLHELVSTGQSRVAQDHARSILGQGLEHWLDLDEEAPSQLLVLVEVALQALVLLERRFTREGTEPALGGLLMPGRRPLGHWLAQVTIAAGGLNLADLDRRLLKKRREGAHVPYDQLRKWSSSTSVLMPRDRLWDVLNAVRECQREVLAARFFAARALSFFCDLLRAGVRTHLSWGAVQAHMLRRYGAICGNYAAAEAAEVDAAR